MISKNYDNMANHWTTINQFVTISSPWMTLIGEKIKDHQGKILDYWRVEKDDSVIIIPVYQNQLLFPVSVFRPGVGKVTLDFPGGRMSQLKNIQKKTLSKALTAARPLREGALSALSEAAPTAVAILERELGIQPSDLNSLIPINNTGWEINSSFSNQKLYGFVAEIKPSTQLNSNLLGASYFLNTEGINNLLNELSCVQCRSLLLEWLRKKNFSSDFSN